MSASHCVVTVRRAGAVSGCICRHPTTDAGDLWAVVAWPGHTQGRRAHTDMSGACPRPKIKHRAAGLRATVRPPQSTAARMLAAPPTIGRPMSRVAPPHHHTPTPAPSHVSPGGRQHGKHTCNEPVVATGRTHIAPTTELWVTCLTCVVHSGSPVWLARVRRATLLVPTPSACAAHVSCARAAILTRGVAIAISARRKL